MNIRKIEEDDSEHYFQLLRAVVSETNFLLFEPSEIKSNSRDEYLNFVRSILLSENSIIFVAEENGNLLGFINATGGRYKKNRLCASVVIGILQMHHHKGLGMRLLKELEHWALSKDIHRLELTVMENNHAALGLYKKMGFEIEGIKKASIFVKGSYINEYYMAKILSKSNPACIRSPHVRDVVSIDILIVGRSLS
jgi:RimJ/RimL family protein N-acetyltransferase